MLKLTFLGTSAGVPAKQRNVTALAIECLNPYLVGSSRQQDNNQHKNQNNNQHKSQHKKSRPWLLIAVKVPSSSYCIPSYLYIN